MLQISGYSDLREIGAGGQAKVYLAIQDSFQRKVAVKVLLPEYTDDADFTQRFLREARTVASLSHPHIIPVYDFGQRDGSFYMSMEFLAGGDLSGRIEKGLEENQILTILSQVATALNFAHEKGYIHRDIKPENIMFREDGSAVLTDFGIARLQNASNQLTAVGQVVGTPKYMSPEQLQGKEVDGRADIYSLGIMFYQMCMKRCPYEDPDFMTLAMKHLKEPIPKLTGKYQKYQRLFERMVAKEREKRFNSGADVVSLIEEIKSGKVDASKIESGTSAQLKARLAAKPESAMKPGQGVKIPREMMLALQDLDPLLDEGWNKTAATLLSTLEQDKRQQVLEVYLAPKGISYNPKEKRLVFEGRPGVQDTIPFLTNPGILAIAKKCQDAQDLLKTTRDPVAFGDLVEGSLGLIDRFDTLENLAFQKQKMILRSAFLDDLVLIARGIDFDVPKNQRDLTADAIRTYIIEIFIRQQIQGYRFKTQSYKNMADDKNTFVRDDIAREVKIRQCEVIRSIRHMFLIGPVKNLTQNPYSIRRFLMEDTAMRGSVVYFNSVAITLSQLNDPKAHEKIRWVVSRIITLERQLSLGITRLVDEMELAEKKYLRPILNRPLEADGGELEQSIEKRLIEYEKSLSMHILGKLPKAIRELASTQDDYEFLFFSLRKLLIDIACDIRDFATQASTVLSSKAEEMDLRMMSFLRLLDKRKDQVFTTNRPEEVDPAFDVELPTEEFKATLDSFEPRFDEARERYKQVLRKKMEPKGKFQLFVERILGLDKKQVTPESVQSEIDSIKHKCLIALIKTCKRYSKITIYLEFEDLVPIDEKMRHYALPAGADGLARLPKLYTLLEDRVAFDIKAVRKVLDHDIYRKVTQGLETSVG